MNRITKLIALILMTITALLAGGNKNQTIARDSQIGFSDYRNDINQNNSAYSPDESPVVTFKSPTNGFSTNNDLVTVKFDIKLNTTKFVNKPVNITIAVADSPDLISSKNLESHPEIQKATFTTKDQIKTFVFENVRMQYSGNNYVYCAVYTDEDFDFDICGGIFTATTLNINYTGSKLPLYRFWGESKQAHFYTINSEEKAHVEQNDPSWEYEGQAYFVNKADSNNKCDSIKKSPVYRFWNSTTQHHFYTINSVEKELIIKNDPKWAYEGIAFCGDVTEIKDSSPVYRFYSKSMGGHFFTINEEEKNIILSTNPAWDYEGIAYYAFK